MSNFFKLNLNDLAGAVVSAVIVSVVGYLGTLTSVMDVNWKEILNVAFLAGIASLLKALGTTQSGEFLGAIKVK